MATLKVDIAGTSAISASQMSEFFRVAGIKGSHINRGTLQDFIEGKNPFPNQGPVNPLKVDPLMAVLTIEEFDFDTIDQDTVANLGGTFNGNEQVLLACPKPKGRQPVIIYLFCPGKSLTRLEQAKETERRGLFPNPWHLIAYALMHPDFAEHHPIATQWQDSEGNFYQALFGIRWGKRHIEVGQYFGGWDNTMSFAGSPN